MHAAHRLAGQHLVICPGNTGDAEVHHAQLAVIQQHNILGLDIPVHDAVGVGMLQRLEDLGDEVHGLPAGKLAAPLVEVLPQGHAVHILHDDILQIIVHRDIVHLDDVRVIQQRDGLGFVLEAADQLFVIKKLFFQHLDGDLVAGADIAAFINIGHAANADQTFNQIAAIQLFADQIIHLFPP